MIADPARPLPHTLRQIEVGDEALAEVDVLLGFDDDLAAEATLPSNRIRCLLTGIHPTLERALDRVCASCSASPATFPRTCTPRCAPATVAAGTMAIRAAGSERVHRSWSSRCRRRKRSEPCGGLSPGGTRPASTASGPCRSYLVHGHSNSGVRMAGTALAAGGQSGPYVCSSPLARGSTSSHCANGRPARR